MVGMAGVDGTDGDTDGGQVTLDAWAIVLAAGSSARFGASKQFEALGEERLVDRAVRVAGSICSSVVVVLPPGVRWDGPTAVAVEGGATRSASVRAGLEAVPATVPVVVVHDAAHPLASEALFRRVLSVVAEGAVAAVPVLRTADVVAHSDGDELGDPIGREGLVLVQMPHAFRASALRAAHDGAPEAVDDASMLRATGARVVVVEGDPANVHVTTPAELDVARALRRGMRH
jgi:2-C-methyl-D-erythritol 4-phosphate cytidylyltransferase